MVKIDDLSKSAFSSETLRKEGRQLGKPQKAANLQRFFKTGPGEYGEGDVFLGLTVPQSRIIAKKYAGLPLKEVEKFLMSPIHEERLIALFILVEVVRKQDTSDQEKIAEFYLAHTKNINNWDLVDLSADKIVGPYLEMRDRLLLDRLAASNLLWERRIAMLTTFHFIKQGQSEDALRIAEQLLFDKHDLIQKAVGWMLREVGKRCGQEIEEAFLLRHYQSMPRTSLRYAVERFSDDKKKFYMQK